jgi:hypothetical protein
VSKQQIGEAVVADAGQYELEVHLQDEFMPESGKGMDAMIGMH